MIHQQQYITPASSATSSSGAPYYNNLNNNNNNHDNNNGGSSGGAASLLTGKGGVTELRSDRTLQQQPVKTEAVSWYIRLILLLSDCLDELLGTMFLVFFVAGIQVVDQYSTNIGLGALEITAVTKGLTSGFILIGIIVAFGKKSGGHFNPLVTLACLLRGHLSPLRALFYWFFQFAGGIAGAAILRGIFGNIAFLGTTIPSGSNGDSVAMEVMLTFIFLTVILAVSERKVAAREAQRDTTSLFSKLIEEVRSLVAPIIIGLTFGAVQAYGWNISGASVNIYRSLCPALVNGSRTALRPVWVYFVGPISGTVCAVLYRDLGSIIDIVVRRIKVRQVDVQHKKAHQASSTSGVEAPNVTHPNHSQWTTWTKEELAPSAYTGGMTSLA